MNNQHNDLTDIIAQALNEIKNELGDRFDLDRINLAELQRRTGISRAKLRHLKENGFVVLPHALIGRKAETTVLSGYTGIIDTLLRKGVKNSNVIFERLLENGYAGGKTSVKTYVREHQHLLPPKRQMVAPQGNRGRRYETDPGECYQMDWGFVTVETASGKTYKIACFAMICHACGKRYVEFFPNAKQENLFIGMIHAFLHMGVPQKILTDNMKSVVLCRDAEGHPVWQKDYELFMGNIGFETRLCKPRHPFTKGAVERLVRYVKDNFIAGRVFTEITDLNYQAAKWCDRVDGTYHRAVDCVPSDKHTALCMDRACILEDTPELAFYLCPERIISFDGFVSYEGRRFGVPYWYAGKTCRVRRDGYVLEIYASDMSRLLTTHDVTWGRRDSWCTDQYASVQPEEKPSMPVKVNIRQLESPEYGDGFGRFNFEEGWPMNDIIFEQIQEAAEYLRLELSAQEIATISMEQAFGENGIEAVAAVMQHLRDKKKDQIISTLLRMSRLPLREPKTFGNFDFDRLHGKHADSLKDLPTLNALYAHRNMALIGPPGVGKTHLAMAYGRACCEKGLKCYFLKATELNQRLVEARKYGREASTVNGLVKPSCLIIDEVGRCVFDIEATRMFFDVIDRRYNKEGPNLMIFTSNKGPDKWGEFFSEDSSLLCALDRIFDDATVYMIKGNSYRGRKRETIALTAGGASSLIKTEN